MNKIYEEIKLYYSDKLSNFNKRLVPTIDGKEMCGVSIPNAKIIAKKYANTDEGFYFLDNCKFITLDEENIYGLMLGYLKVDIDVLMKYLDIFLSHLDNWLSCDITCANLKIIKKMPDFFKKNTKIWLKSDNFYVKRFAVVILLDYFLNENFDKNDLYNLANFSEDDYYFNMALAWYFSVAIVKQYDETIKIFENYIIKNKFVHNKSIQKCVESFRVSDKNKNYLKSLKI